MRKVVKSLFSLWCRVVVVWCHIVVLHWYIYCSHSRTMSPRPIMNNTYFHLGYINGVGSTQFAKQFKHQKSTTAKTTVCLFSLNITTGFVFGFGNFKATHNTKHKIYTHSSSWRLTQQQQKKTLSSSSWIQPSINFPFFAVIVLNFHLALPKTVFFFSYF